MPIHVRLYVSWIRNTPLLSFVTNPALRAKTGPNYPRLPGWSAIRRQLIDIFRVEHQIVALKQAGDGGAVNLHLGVADTDRAISNHPGAFDAFVGHFDAFDTQ